jgi:hypothetical protein
MLYELRPNYLRRQWPLLKCARCKAVPYHAGCHRASVLTIASSATATTLHYDTCYNRYLQPLFVAPPSSSSDKYLGMLRLSRRDQRGGLNSLYVSSLLSYPSGAVKRGC